MKNKHWAKILFGKRLMVVFLIIVQIFIIAGGLTLLGKTFEIAGLCLTIFSLIVALYVVNFQKIPEYKLSWVFFILVFPLFGGVIYALSHLKTSRRKYGKELEKIRRHMEEINFRISSDNEINNKVNSNKVDINKINSNNSFQDKNVGIEFLDEKYAQYDLQMNYLSNTCGFPCYKNTKLMYLEPGEQIFTVLLEELKRARKYIFMEFFIITDGQMWDAVLRVLEEKAKDGVDVRLIYDDMGSLLHFTKKELKQLQEKGIQIITFNPFMPIISVFASNRNHRKIVVVDGKVAFTGGINLADEYINKHKIFGYWMDAGIFLYGMGAWGFTTMFLQMWALCTRKMEDYSHLYPWRDQICSIGTDGLVQSYSDGPIDSETTAANVYLQLIYSAKNYLYMESPYLVLGQDFMCALSLAAKSGVDVRILVPFKDFPVVKQNTQSYYSDLIKAGVRIFEYSKGMMHSKVFVCDDKVAVVGTVNLDFRGMYLHHECGVKLYESSAIRDIKACFVNNMNKSIEIHEADCRKKLFGRLLEFILRVFSSLF